jgi:hypothetical protein
MVKALRKRLIIAAIVLLAGGVAVAFTGDRVREAVSFVLLSPAEKKLVGEWKAIAMGGEVVTTLRADHTFTSAGGCLEGTSRGRWAIDGSDIIYYYGDQPARDAAAELHPFRMPIQRLIEVDREAREWLAKYAKK